MRALWNTYSNFRLQSEHVRKTYSNLQSVGIVDAKAKGTSAFLQGVEEDEPYQESAVGEEGALDGDLEDGGDQFVYLEDGDLDRVFEESEVQIVLATYQEIRKAIQNNQKGRQFYRGGKGKSKGSSGSDFLKGKRKVHIEQLKLRTRCAKCGTVGHWARECTSPPDQRGRQNAAVAAAASSAHSKSTTSTSSVGQQSWYVSSAGQGDLGEVSICFSCEGNHSKDESGDSFGIDCPCSDDGMQDEPRHNPLVRGKRDLIVCMESTDSVFDPSNQWSSCCFVGLTTSPTMAVVDTAAQDGLVGVRALERLKEQLTAFGLQISWSSRKAKAHGIGGAAKVVGVAALPLGLAGSSGVLEATVVDNEVPLLLPVKMLRSLQAVIDVGEECMHLRALNRSVELSRLPSGHLAVDVLDFGPSGFQHPVEAVEYHESDFRCNHGSETGYVMLTHLKAPTAFDHPLNHGRSPCCSAEPSRKMLEARETLSHARGKVDSAQFQACCEALEGGARQDLCVGGFGWTRGLGSFLASFGYDQYTAFNTVLKAVGRAHRPCRTVGASQVQVQAGQVPGGLQARGGTAGDGCKPVFDMGDLSRLPEGEDFRRCSELDGCDQRGDQERVQERVPDPTQQREGQPCEVHEGLPCRAEEDCCSRVQHGQGDEDVEVRTEGGLKDGAVDEHHGEQLCRDGHGSRVCGAPRLP